jgi:hypothetical protein
MVIATNDRYRYKNITQTYCSVITANHRHNGNQV